MVATFTRREMCSHSKSFGLGLAFKSKDLVDLVELPEFKDSTESSQSNSYKSKDFIESSPSPARPNPTNPHESKDFIESSQSNTRKSNSYITTLHRG
jgi:hypothetical protein